MRLGPAGLLRLGALWRQQSSLLHDPQQKLHDELVTPLLRPATLLFLTLNIGRHQERGAKERQEDSVCVCVCVCIQCVCVCGGQQRAAELTIGQLELIDTLHLLGALQAQ